MNSKISKVIILCIYHYYFLSFGDLKSLKVNVQEKKEKLETKTCIKVKKKDVKFF